VRLVNKTDITPELIANCIKDDRKEIKRLYEICFKMLVPICMRYHKNEEDARSSFNIGFIKLLNSLHAVDKNINIVGWAKRIMVNTLIDEYRKTKNYLSHIVTKENEWELEQQNSSYENEGESNIGYELILKLVAQLPEITGKVFNLSVIDGYSHKEIAEILDMSEGTSKWHLSTGRKLLREKIEELEKIREKMVV
jgi:RNA polymerase sigma-70 factor (ECF subfamily)